MLVAILALFGVVGFMGLKMAWDSWQAEKRVGAVILGLVGLAFGGVAVAAAVAWASR